jgi:hypothetical protein
MRVALISLLLLTACTDGGNVLEDLPNNSIAGAERDSMPEDQIEGALVRDVTIGEDGPRLDACGARGIVRRAGAQGLALRAAPFSRARATESLAEGTRLHICTRSLDQRWLGVVVIPPPLTPSEGGNVMEAAPTDCGVSEPVERKQPYDGPCRSGWVASSYVELIAD